MTLQDNRPLIQRRAAHEFITDNPFRLLSLPSSTPVRVLRQKASAAEQSARVGLPVEIGLVISFGDDELGRCSDLVRSLSANATTRTLHRQMWPYQLRPQEESPPLATLPPDAAALAEFHTYQWHFLRHWFDFTLADHAPSLARALDCFVNLYNDDEHEGYLVRILQEEGESETDAYNAVVEAQNGLAVFIAQEACSRALEMLNARKQGEFRAIIGAIQNWPLEAEAIERSVTSALVTYGNQKRERVDQEHERTQDALSKAEWSPLWADFDLSDVMLLRELSTSIGEHSVSHLWQMSAHRYVDLIGEAMRQYAVTAANNNDDYHVAKAVLNRVLELPVSPSLSAKVALDLSALADLTASTLREQAAPVRPAQSGEGPPFQGKTQKSNRQTADRGNLVGIKSVTSAPPLFTLNGCGLKLYGRSTCRENPQWHYTTLFLTLVFIPVIPLARYLVSDAPKGRVNFHATAPFTGWHAAHLIAGLLVGIWLAFLLFQPSDPSANRSTAVPSDSSMTAPPSTTDNPHSTAERDNLVAEGERLKADMDTLAAWLKKSESAIDDNKQRLNGEKVDIAAHEESIKTNRQILDRYNPEAVARFNKSLDSARRELQVYNHDIREFNAEVKQHNQVLRRARSEQQRLAEIAQAVNNKQ